MESGVNFIKFTEIGIQFLSRKQYLPDFFPANFPRNKVTAKFKQYTKLRSSTELSLNW